MQTSQQKVAIQALRAAAKVLDHAQLNRQSQAKGYLYHGMMRTKQRVLEEIKQTLLHWYPKHHFYMAQSFFDRPKPDLSGRSTASGTTARKLSHHWCIHGLGNPVNFVKGYPYYSLAVSLAQNEEWVLSAVYDPVHNELFSVDKSSGAQLEGRRVRLSNTPLLESELCVGVVMAKPCLDLEPAQPLLGLLSLCNAGFILRFGGDAALSLVYLLAGRLDLLLVDRSVLEDAIFKFWLAEAAGVTAPANVKGENNPYYWVGAERKIELAKRLLLKNDTVEQQAPPHG